MSYGGFLSRRLKSGPITKNLITVFLLNDVTRILESIKHGDPKAADELLPLVYEELRKLAAVRMASPVERNTSSAASRKMVIFHMAFANASIIADIKRSSETVSSYQSNAECAIIIWKPRGLKFSKILRSAVTFVSNANPLQRTKDCTAEFWMRQSSSLQLTT